MGQDVEYTLASSSKLEVRTLIDHGTKESIKTNHHFLEKFKVKFSGHGSFNNKTRHNTINSQQALSCQVPPLNKCTLFLLLLCSAVA